MNLVPKDYIGDGIYAECNGDEIVLTTENGVSVQNRIIFEDRYRVEALIRFLMRSGFRIIYDGVHP